MKKILIGILSFFGLLVLIAVVVPFFVDVDKYRPELVSKANQSINGKLEIGKLGLSLWGKIKVQIDGLKLSDAKGQPILSVQDANVVIPVMSLISGSPELRLELKEPQVSVTKFKNGELNVMTLVKKDAADSAAAAGTANTKAVNAEPANIPAIALRSRLTFLLSNAKLTYKDELTGDVYKINEINFKVKDVSLTREIPFELVALLDMTMQKQMTVKGPLVWTGSIQAFLNNGEFDKATLKTTLKMDAVSIKYGNLFEKGPGVPLGFDMQGSATKTTLTIPSMKLKLAEAELDSKVDVKMGDATSFNFYLDSNKIDIAKLGKLVPMIAEYGMNGDVELVAQASGPTNKVDYAANIRVAKMSIKSANMKQALVLNGVIDVVTNKLKDATLKLNAKNFDLSLKGMLEDFSKPRFKFDLNSQVMNLDELLVSSEKAAQARKEETKNVNSGKSADNKAPAVDYNAMLAPLRDNPMAAATSGTLDFKIKKMVSTGVQIDDLSGNLAMNNLVMVLKNLSMRIFDGTIKGSMSFNAKPAKPEVGMNLNVAGLKTQKMLESQVPFAKNTVKGSISSNVNMGGSGLNPDDVSSAWKGSGNFDIDKAVFSTIDFGPQIRQGVIDKLPAFAKSKVKIPENIANWKGDYQYVKTKFALDKGVFAIQSIDGKAYPNKGLDLKGSGTINLKDYSLDMGLDLIDTYNVFNLDGTAKDKRYNHFAVSPKVKGTMFSPAFDWTATLGQLGKNAVQSQGKEMLQKAVGSKIPGLGGSGGGSEGDKKPAVPSKDDIKKGLKGLFGH